MSAEISPTEIQQFYDFLGHHLQNGPPGLTPEQSVLEFRAYQAELDRFREAITAARKQGEAGEAAPLDVDALLERVRKRVAERE